MAPEVSIVMPVRDAQDTIDAAIRSVVAQTWTSWELIVLDDGSTDDTVERALAWAASDARIVVISDGLALGISARLNQGVRSSRASVVARMDGDDICYPHRLATQWEFLRDNPEVDVVGAGTMVFSSDGTPRGSRSHPGGHDALTKRPFINGIPLSHPTWMGRRAWFVRFPYDARARGCEDWEVLLRGHTSSRYASLPDVLLGYREDRIKLRRSLVARRHEVRILLRYGLRYRQLVSGLAGAVLEVAKGARDTVAVLSRRQHLVLARRNAVPSPTEVAAWQALWVDCVLT